LKNVNNLEESSKNLSKSSYIEYLITFLLLKYIKPN